MSVKTIKDICTEYGLGQTALSRRFGIPLRTVQNWHSGERIPPDYVVRMIDELLRDVYLISKDSMDDACEIVGYIKGTEKEAAEYCNEYNEKQRKHSRMAEYEIIHDLRNKDK